VHDFNSTENDTCTSKIFEAKHWSRSSFDGSMILLDNVIEILALSDHHLCAVLPIVIFESGLVRSALVDVGDTRKEIVLDRARKKSTCGTTISFGGEKEIYGVSLLIHRTIQIAILTANLDVRFVHAPTFADCADATFALSPSERFLLV
jgi:hypothetical protein